MSEAGPAAAPSVGGDLAVLTGVSKSFPAKGAAEPVRALRKVTLSIRRGGRVAIRGDSGSGKSTLLSLLGGLDVASRGEVRVDGEDLTTLGGGGLAEYRARKVGFVFQSFNLLPDLSALENVELPMENGSIPVRERRARAQELLDAVGMTDRAEHRPARLSGGEQQRVAIARALANRPVLLLADEPTGNLDKTSRRRVVRLLQKVNEEYGTTIVIVTHDPNVANACDVVHVLKRGKLTAEYTPAPAKRRAAEAAEADDDRDVPEEDEEASDSDDDEA